MGPIRGIPELKVRLTIRQDRMPFLTSKRIRLTNHTADRGSDLPRLFSAGGPRSGRELGDSMHWHIGQSR